MIFPQDMINGKFFEMKQNMFQALEFSMHYDFYFIFNDRNLIWNKYFFNKQNSSILEWLLVSI